eukprot:GHVT01035475.1.p1 GENE.GHVT01035475.1~~GHVT01035475.1.p1  ORF type:complete len:161 (+),score=35.46 GHVT01035475.1:102-584(+)
MSTVSFSNASAPQAGPEPAEEESLSDSGKRMAVGSKNQKGVSKFWVGLGISFVVGGILSVLSAPHKSRSHDVGRLWKPNKGKVALVTNAPLGAGAATHSTHSALPPPQALATAFPLEARAPHNEALAAAAQLRRDFEECLDAIAPSNFRPASRGWRHGIK